VRGFVASKISDHLAWTPEGYLICTGVVLCRTGTQQYRGDEIFGDGSDVRITVHRSAADVLADRHAASLEGKPVCGPGHPATSLSPQNVAVWQRGHAQNIRAGTLPSGESCLIGDLVITDRNLAEQIVAGQAREISTGYTCEYSATSDGTIYQKDFLANHIAVVQSARANAGRPAEVRIMDGATGGNMKVIDWRDAKTLENLRASEALQVLEAISQTFSRSEKQKTQDATVEDQLLANVNGSPEAIEFCEAANRLGRKLRGQADTESFETILKRYRGQGSRANDDRHCVEDAHKSPTEDANEYASDMKAFHRK
jgi:hypothetical protein